MDELIWAASIVAGRHAVWAEWAEPGKFQCNDESVMKAFYDLELQPLTIRALCTSLGVYEVQVEDSFAMASFLVSTVTDLYDYPEIITFYGSKYAPRITKRSKDEIVLDGDGEEVTHRHRKLPESRFGYYNPQIQPS